MILFRPGPAIADLPGAPLSCEEQARQLKFIGTLRFFIRGMAATRRKEDKEERVSCAAGHCLTTSTVRLCQPGR